MYDQAGSDDEEQGVYVRQDNRSSEEENEEISNSQLLREKVTGLVESWLANSGEYPSELILLLKALTHFYSPLS